MTFKYTNVNDVSLALAVFLMHDTYQHDARPNSISATGIMRPLRQLILSHKAEKSAHKEVDIVDLVASRMGTAIHSGCEAAWTDRSNVDKALQVLGLSKDKIAQVKINPESVNTGDIPVYVEQRHEKKLGDFIITGMYDLVLDGTLNDYKSTSVYTVIFDSNAEKYTQQGSIYKWLSPNKIIADYVNINFILTDWSAVKARQDRSYPQLRVMTKKYPLWPVEQTEQWLSNKIAQFVQLMHLPEESLPECTDEELWATETKYKYFKNPLKLTRATKNFDSMDEALIRKSADGDVGTIKTVPGEVKACRYCQVVGTCQQAEGMLASGRLML